MPSKGGSRAGGARLDKESLLLLKVIERWKETAAKQVDDIGGWRDAVDERKKHRGDTSRYWVAPNRFETDTIFITNWMAKHAPLLDARSVTRVCTIVLTWQREHSARGIPSQRRLLELLRWAMSAVCAVEAIVERPTLMTNHGITLERPVVVARAAEQLDTRPSSVLRSLRRRKARVDEQAKPRTVELQDLLRAFPRHRKALLQWAESESPE